MLLSLGVPFAEEYSPRANFFGIDIASELLFLFFLHCGFGAAISGMSPRRDRRLVQGQGCSPDLGVQEHPDVLIVLKRVPARLSAAPGTEGPLASLHCPTTACPRPCCPAWPAVQGEGGVRLAVEVDGPQHFSCESLSVAVIGQHACNEACHTYRAPSTPHSLCLSLSLSLSLREGVAMAWRRQQGWMLLPVYSTHTYRVPCVLPAPTRPPACLPPTNPLSLRFHLQPTLRTARWPAR